MITCGEYDLDDLLAVTAIPVTDYSVGAYGWQVMPTIPNTALLSDTDKRYCAWTATCHNWR